MEDQQCPIWGTECASITKDEGSVIVTDSPRAGGTYQLYDDAAPELRNLTTDEKARLTTALVRESFLGNPCPAVNLNAIGTAKTATRTRMEERLTNLLLRMVHSMTKAGLPVEIGSDASQRGHSANSEEAEAWRNTQFALAYSESADFDELEYLADSLAERGLIKKGRRLRNYYVSTRGFLYMVTARGYIEIERLQTERQSDQCFVALWFNEATDALYDRAIAPSVRAAGYQPLRIDQKPDFLGKIDDQIIAEIRRSRFMIADFTHGDGGVRGSVYYEVGFAQGLDIPVIFTCRDDQLDDLHFDTNHFLHLSWPRGYAEALIEPLKNRILANIGEGPHIDGGE